MLDDASSHPYYLLYVDVVLLSNLTLGGVPHFHIIRIQCGDEIQICCKDISFI
jgi:hypothetical protein